MASPELASDYVSLFEDIRSEWISLPAPIGIQLTEMTRAEVSEVEAVAMMHGWVARIIRSGEALLALSALGFAAELAPLRRSMLEHAISLRWVADQRGDAFQVLIRRHSQSMQRIQDAQENGWEIEGEEAQRLLQQAIDVETDEETRTYDHLGAIAHQAEAYGLGDVYLAWLLETLSSHASIASAHPYYSFDSTSNTVQLHRTPRETGTEVEASVLIPVLLGLTAYNMILEGEPLNDRISSWTERFAALQERLATEISDDVLRLRQGNMQPDVRGN